MTVEKIISACAKAWGVSAGDVMGRSRHKGVTAARKAAMLMTRDLFGLSYPEIGKRFGRDHSTVMHYIKSANRKLKEEPTYARRFAEAVMVLRRGSDCGPGYAMCQGPGGLCASG